MYAQGYVRWKGVRAQCIDITIQLLDLNPVQVPCPHPTPDPFLDEEQTGWCDLHSLSSLKLTLDRVIQDCILPQSIPTLHHKQ